MYKSLHLAVWGTSPREFYDYTEACDHTSSLTKFLVLVLIQVKKWTKKRQYSGLSTAGGCLEFNPHYFEDCTIFVEHLVERHIRTTTIALDEVQVWYVVAAIGEHVLSQIVNEIFDPPAESKIGERHVLAIVDYPLVW